MSELRKINREELQKIIENHQHYLEKDVEGWENMKANLSEADLSEVDLSKANLRYADLRGAKLRGANLYEATFTGAKLYDSSRDLIIKQLNEIISVFEDADIIKKED